MTREVILTTLPDGGVAITIPDEEGIRYLTVGPTGTWHPWFGTSANFWIIQFNRKIARGVPAKAAYDFCDRMRRGGATRREALEIISAYVTWAFGTASEIVDISEIPDTRAHRAAWRRSTNGGPIWIDEEHAQRIDEARCWEDFNART